MSQAIAALQKKSLNQYENLYETYQEMVIQINKDLCDKDFPITLKKQLSGIGISLSKPLEFFRSCIASFGSE